MKAWIVGHRTNRNEKGFIDFIIDRVYSSQKAAKRYAETRDDGELLSEVYGYDIKK